MSSLPTFSSTSIHFITLELSNAFKHDWYDCHFYVNAAILLTSYTSSIVNLCETSSRGVPVQLCPDVVCGNRLYRAVLHIHSYVQSEVYLFLPTDRFCSGACCTIDLLPHEMALTDSLLLRSAWGRWLVRPTVVPLLAISWLSIPVAVSVSVVPLSWKMTHCLVEYAQLSSLQLPYLPLTSLFSGQSSNALGQAIADSAQSGVSHDTPSLALGFLIIEILDTFLFCTCVSMYALGENEDSYRRSLPGCYFISCTRCGRWLGRHRNPQWSGPQSGAYYISGALYSTLNNLSSRVAMSCLEGLYSSFVCDVIHPQSLTIY